MIDKTLTLGAYFSTVQYAKISQIDSYLLAATQTLSNFMATIISTSSLTAHSLFIVPES